MSKSKLQFTVNIIGHIDQFATCSQRIRDLVLCCQVYTQANFVFSQNFLTLINNEYPKRPILPYVTL